MKRICVKCGKEKEIEEFSCYVRNKDQTRYRRTCSECFNYCKREKYPKLKDKERNRGSVYYWQNRDSIQERARQKYRYLKYGSLYEELNEKQNNKCAVCGNEEKAMRAGRIKDLAVDHCHVSGKVRGLLCQRCNLMLGAVNDNIIILQKMIDYLNENSINI